MTQEPSIDVRGTLDDRFEEVLTERALAFVAELHRRFEPRRQELIQAREKLQARIDGGEDLSLLTETREIREGDWTVAPPPPEVAQRRVEITGPTDRKMLINALNSGANVFMADLEDANVPRWSNMIGGQVNLRDANRGDITFTKPDGTVYELDDETAELFVRPRGIHLTQPELRVDGEPVAGALLDFGLYVFHNARERASEGKGTYFYIPKLEHHLEARWWNDVFTYAEDALELETGTFRATVLLETLPAAFQMEEILYELREHSLGLNAGRWDYIYSAIKTYRNRDVLFPDRGEITMTVPFMQAYTEWIVRACHKRGAHAMGGMAAFIPSKDPEVNEEAFAAVRADKQREASAGFDGTWIAHPGLVEVARAPFDDALGDSPNQIHETRPEVDDQVAPEDLLDFEIPDASITEEGLRTNVSVGIQYISSWLTGWGAAAIDNLMEDTATAEISRAQVWQWIQAEAELDDGRQITRALVSRIIDEELEKIRAAVGDEAFEAARPKHARELFERVALADDFPLFLTIPGMAYLAEEVA